MKNISSVQELNEERYEIIDTLVDNSDVIDFINSVEKIQKTLMTKDIQANEMYRYLLTIMLNQC
jgi:hypothetical protein